MEQRIKALREQMEQRIGQIDTKDKLAAFWQDFLGKKGAVADLMKGLGAVAKEDRPAVGKIINEFKVQVEEKYQNLSAKMDELELAALNGSLGNGRVVVVTHGDERNDGTVVKPFHLSVNHIAFLAIAGAEGCHDAAQHTCLEERFYGNHNYKLETLNYKLN